MGNGEKCYFIEFTTMAQLWHMKSHTLPRQEEGLVPIVSAMKAWLHENIIATGNQ